MTQEATEIKKCLYIDLSNIYGGITEIFEAGVYIDFATLMPLLDEEFGGVDQFKVYGAYMGEKPGMPNYKKQMIRAQNEFLNSAKLAGVYFGQGTISNDGHEKGVDMQIGVDMVHDAHNGTFTDFILMSGDADFQYAIQIVKSLGKTFHYCGFANRYAISFAFEAWRKVVIDYKGLFNELHGEWRHPKTLRVVDVYNHKSVKTSSISLYKTYSRR